MAQIRLEKDRQLTLPMTIMSAARLQANDLLEVSFVNGDIILRPVRGPEQAAANGNIMEFAGACPGVWGSSPREVETTLARDRASWER